MMTLQDEMEFRQLATKAIRRGWIKRPDDDQNKTATSGLPVAVGQGNQVQFIAIDGSE